MSISPKRILIIYTHPGSPEKMRLTIKHHLQVLESSSIKHKLFYYNTHNTVPYWVSNDTPIVPPSEIYKQSFDVIILHYSFLSNRTTGHFFYTWKRHFSWIAELNCLKMAIPQDEFSCASLLDEWLFEFGVSVIFSVQYTKEGPLYAIMRNNATIYPCLPGYIDEITAKNIAKLLCPLSERPNDIVYRARHLPYRFGSAGQMKHQIAEIIISWAQKHQLKYDISTQGKDAIFGGWLDFLASSKAIIGMQGGSSAIDWRGELRVMEEMMRIENPNLSFDDFSAKMPVGWDDYRLFTITPRHFEAIITKTCQILLEGQFRGILQSNEHYIPIKKDFSNLNEVLEKIRDDHYVQNIVDQTYQDIYLSGQYNYRIFADLIEKAILDQERKSKSKTKEYTKLMLESDKTVEILERQLIAERHNNTLLQAQLLKIKDPEMGWLQLLLKKKNLLIILGLSAIFLNAIITTILIFVLLKF